MTNCKVKHISVEAYYAHVEGPHLALAWDFREWIFPLASCRCFETVKHISSEFLQFDGIGPSRQDPVAAAGGATRRSSDTIE